MAITARESPNRKLPSPAGMTNVSTKLPAHHHTANFTHELNTRSVRKQVIPVSSKQTGAHKTSIEYRADSFMQSTFEQIPNLSGKKAINQIIDRSALRNRACFFVNLIILIKISYLPFRFLEAWNKIIDREPTRYTTYMRLRSAPIMPNPISDPLPNVVAYIKPIRSNHTKEKLSHILYARSLRKCKSIENRKIGGAKNKSTNKMGAISSTTCWHSEPYAHKPI